MGARRSLDEAYAAHNAWALATFRSLMSSLKYALTDLLICGRCGTSYRRVVWSRNGVKKTVWRCISRLEYGTKYCTDSPSIEESVIHQAIIEAISEIANADGYQTALKNLQLHIRMYFGGADETEPFDAETRLNQLIEAVMQKAKDGNSNDTEFITLSQQIAETKKYIADKKAMQAAMSTNKSRMNEVLNILDSLKNHPIEYDDYAVRQLIECVKVVSKNELLIIFKGGIEKRVAIN